jgi:hypothetical protein
VKTEYKNNKTVRFGGLRCGDVFRFVKAHPEYNGPYIRTEQSAEIGSPRVTHIRLETGETRSLLRPSTPDFLNEEVTLFDAVLTLSER